MNKSKKYFFDAGEALWKQRQKISEKSLYLEKLAKAINHLNDSGLPQYAQLYSFVLDFKPNIIFEVGRGYGNSTVVLTEAANQLKETRKIVSVCLSNDWQEIVVPKLKKIVDNNWFSKLDPLIADILNIDINHYIAKKDSVMFFWDAHGWDVSERIIGDILPKIQNNQHLVLVHDVLDTRYHSNLKKYQGNGIWKGYFNEDVNPQFLNLDNMSSPFEEIISINDFALRNGLKIHSVEHELREKIFNNNVKTQTMIHQIGKEMGQAISSFIWFSLNEIKDKKIIFPKISNINIPAKKSFSNFKKFTRRPLISIITPCFNSKKYISECIESVLNQDYLPIEHVIQDGGSTDGTIKLLKKYSKKYKNIIKWKSEKDNGQSDGLNKALQRAKGEIILVLNADDVLMPYACSWGMVNMELYPDSAVIYGDEYIIDERSKIIRFFTGPEPYDFEKILCVEQVIPAQAAFIRRSALVKAGFYADKSLRTCPDYEMWVRIGLKFPMKHVYGPIAKYRWHKWSEGQRPEMIDEMVKAKRLVMDRMFSDSKSPKKIVELKGRAYAGVEEWASNVSATLGDRKRVFFYLSKSTFLHPEFHKVLRLGHIIIKYCRIFILSSIKRNL